ncbi:beta-mannosidase [Soonwooa buanensis]|uniref:Beta-mannosidase n=1 Tax=Soonwooa buanensis TaxID=619805 RepID=A0A1T5F2A4_9FLAO|nr:glycoside hydrolase family 2 protein [Soonwooa buanensis]SKB90178.1 beta-mannosidase [Soonwooa buanensis]
MSSQSTTRSLSSTNWEFKNVKDEKWLKASVPGTVHTDLMAHKIIPDPFLDENEKKVQWIENEDWEYRCHFTITNKEWSNLNKLLIFEGLDTFTEIHINGRPLTKTFNMFAPEVVYVSDYLREGENVLTIKFTSSVKEGKELAKEIPFQLPESPRSLVRKAQYQFGWDWGPRLVTAGIWKDVKLITWDEAKIENIRVEQKSITDKKADLVFHTEIDASEIGDDDLEKLQVSINGKIYKNLKLKRELNKVSFPFEIKNPKLWQPNGVGKPEMYDFKISVINKGKVIDSQTERIGLRTIELVQEKDEKGKSFYFKVNGKPLYIKGSNWIPADSFLPRITKEKYHKLIADAKEANMNMIRVWGGGIYEDDEFYKACDENGILVWQDFAFAGSFYPSDERFQENVKNEVKSQVKRLQNHPSLALWCGNNEVDEAIVNWGYQKQFKYSKADSLQVWRDYKTIFHEVIPKTLQEVSPNAIYWPSSPSIGWGHKESLTEGDSHYWGVWWGEQPFEIYNEKVPRFASEYGFQGMPSLEATKAMFSGKPDLNLKNPVILAHQKHPKGWEIINKYMERDYKVPTDFVQYNYVSQLLQARGMQIAIEAHRRNKPYNMGTLIWQLNDCWPVVSWSAIDYLGNWKALHYQTKRSFEPQIFSMEKEGNNYKVFFINDDFKKVKGKFKLSLLNFKGETMQSFDKEILVNQNSSTQVYDFNNLIFKGITDKLAVLKIELKTPDKIISKLHFFVSPKDLNLPKPNIKIKKISPTEIEVSTDVLAKDVYLIGDTHFSDNFFDLLPNEKRKIKLSKTLDKVDVMSLWDTMQ